MANDVLTDEGLRLALGARPFRYLPQVTSTNDIALDWADAPSGAVVVTEEQTAGRGRFGRAWIAPSGSALLFSVVLRPRIDQSRVSRLTMVGAVAIAETLASLPAMVIDLVGLKWPNDVNIAGRKVAGILPELIWEGDELKVAVLGIGLNVRNDFSGTPLEAQATSIERETGATVDRADLLSRVLSRIDYWIGRLDEHSLLGTWRAWLTTIGQQVKVRTLNLGGAKDATTEVISGLAEDVDEEGALVLRLDDGTTRLIAAGEVSLRS
jgi:BirA family biotin operon repressor/biotin-[acetyl-CoA-carboxylase] ligase